MDALERRRREVAGDYAKRNCNAETLEKILRLERGNAELREEIALIARSHPLRAGRWVFGHALAAGLLIVSVLLIGAWLGLSADGRALRGRVARGVESMTATVMAP